MKPQFDAGRGLVLWNYTPVAHNTLHAVRDGWGPVLRQCRGIIFDRRGKLVALPFPKFFNLGEHPETQLLPNEPFDATEKHDGHLGIAFRHAHCDWVTTRGSFHHRTGAIATRMWREHLRDFRWARQLLEQMTLLFEVIHPETRVLRNYGSRKALVLTGAYDTVSLHDFDHEDLATLGRQLGIPVAQRWPGDLSELVSHARDRGVRNREGWVVRFRGGLRMKVKYETYIGRMVEEKLSRTYLLRRLAAGNAERMLDTLPEEIYARGTSMLAELRAAAELPESNRREYLLTLQGDAATSAYKAAVDAYLKTLRAS